MKKIFLLLLMSTIYVHSSFSMWRVPKNEETVAELIASCERAVEKKLYQYEFTLRTADNVKHRVLYNLNYKKLLCLDGEFYEYYYTDAAFVNTPKILSSIPKKARGLVIRIRPLTLEDKKSSEIFFMRRPIKNQGKFRTKYEACDLYGLYLYVPTGTRKAYGRSTDISYDYYMDELMNLMPGAQILYEPMWGSIDHKYEDGRLFKRKFKSDIFENKKPRKTK